MTVLHRLVSHIVRELDYSILPYTSAATKTRSEVRRAEGFPDALARPLSPCASSGSRTRLISATAENTCIVSFPAGLVKFALSCARQGIRISQTESSTTFFYSVWHCIQSEPA